MKLLFFTYAYPYGVGELWKTNELKVLKDYFQEITVIPYCYGNNKIPSDKIAGLNYLEPLFAEGVQIPRNFILKLQFLISKNIGIYLIEFLTSRVFLSGTKFRSWVESSFKMYSIAKTPRFKNVIKAADINTILYFYWGRETSEVLPIIHNLNNNKIISRFHGYDLYRERNNGYIPYQYFQIKKLDFALPCSEFGRKTLSSYYPDLKEKIVTKRLGTIGKGKSEQNDLENFTILSCSFIEKVKRLEIIAKAIHFIDFKIRWIHIGDGSMFSEIKSLCEKLPENVTVDFKGGVKNDEVIDFYANNRLDLFLNVSESEGVPISIMEAFAASIPVFATDVGGTHEIVDNNVGKLLPKDITPQNLAFEIGTFRNLSYDQKKAIRANAYNIYRTKCDANELAHDFASFLTS